MPSNELSNTYFKETAPLYDNRDEKPYWSICNELLWSLFSEFLHKNMPETFSFIDAGTGTGTWALNVAKNFRGSHGILVEQSSDMMSVAKAKLSNSEVTNVEFVELPIEKFRNNGNQTDLVYIFNVLCFVDSVEECLKNLGELIKHGGYLILVVQNSLYSMSYKVRSNEMSSVLKIKNENKSRFYENMPYLNELPIEDYINIIKKYDFNIVQHLGYPIITDSPLKGDKLYKSVLANENFRKELLLIEKELIRNTNSRSRGAYNFIVAKKM